MTRKHLQAMANDKGLLYSKNSIEAAQALLRVIAEIECCALTDRATAKIFADAVNGNE